MYKVGLKNSAGFSYGTAIGLLTQSSAARCSSRSTRCRGVTGLELDHVRVFASEETRKRWSGMLQAEDCPGLVLKDCVL